MKYIAGLVIAATIALSIGLFAFTADHAPQAAANYAKGVASAFYGG